MGSHTTPPRRRESTWGDEFREIFLWIVESIEAFFSRWRTLVVDGRRTAAPAKHGSATHAPTSSVPGTIAHTDAAEDPLGTLWHRVSYSEDAAASGRLINGAFRDPDYGVVFGGTDSESNVLTLGPPRSAKTSGVLAAQACAHLGATFIISTKPDLAQLTAVACARKGPIYHLDLTGRRTYSGMITARWNMLAGGETFTGAKRIASTVTKAAAPPGAINHKFWESLGARWLAVPIYAANLAGKHKTAEGYQFLLDCVNGEEAALDEMEAILEAHGGDDGQVALKTWRSFEDGRVHAEGVGSVRITVMQALAPLEAAEVRAASAQPNLDLATLLASTNNGVLNTLVGENAQVRNMASIGVAGRDGWPAIGHPPTIYVSIDQGDDEAALLPRIFVHQLWGAIKDRHEADQAEGITGRPKVLLIWDELATGFPDPDYPRIVAQCADQGLIISTVLHDLGQAQPIWGQTAESLLTLHRYINVFRGVRHTGTLQALSTIIGNRWEARSSITRSRNIGGAHDSSTFGDTEGEQRLPILDPGQIREGKAGDPKALLCIVPDGWHYIWPTPLWGASPWPRALITTMRLVADWDFSYGGQHYPFAALPVPELDRSDASGTPILVRTQRNGAALLNEYRQLKAHYDQVRRAQEPNRMTAKPPPPPARWTAAPPPPPPAPASTRPTPTPDGPRPAPTDLSTRILRRPPVPTDNDDSMGA
jgi:hypothetical protein